MGDLQTHYGSTSETQAPGARSIAPGRVAATARLAPRITASTVNPAAMTAPPMSPAAAGEPALDPFGVHLLGEQTHQDLAQACDVGGPGCVLAERDLQRLMRDLDNRIISARENWLAAILSKKIDLATMRTEGWGMLWKVAATLASAGVGAGVGAGLEFLAEAAETVTAAQAVARLVNNEERVHQLFEFAVGALEHKVEHKVNEAANEDTAEAAAYLTSQLDNPGRWAATLLKTYPQRLDHYGMILLRGIMDPANFTVAAFVAQIEALLARWEDQVHAVGKGGGGYKQTVAWVFPRGGGSPRLARVMAFAGPGAIDNNLTAQVFKTWVDPDMRDIAFAEATEKHMLCEGMTTLATLANVPTDDATVAWDRGTIANTTEEVATPTMAYSQEDVRP